MIHLANTTYTGRHNNDSPNDHPHRLRESKNRIRLLTTRCGDGGCFFVFLAETCWAFEGFVRLTPYLPPILSNPLIAHL
jgi:hypothetical protein